MSRALLETALRILLHVRNVHDTAMRCEYRALIHHDIQRLRAMP